MLLPLQQGRNEGEKGGVIALLCIDFDLKLVQTMSVFSTTFGPKEVMIQKMIFLSFNWQHTLCVDTRFDARPTAVPCLHLFTAEFPAAAVKTGHELVSRAPNNREKNGSELIKPSVPFNIRHWLSPLLAQEKTTETKMLQKWAKQHGRTWDVQ